MTKILAISGSLRSESSNSTLLRAAAALAPQDIQVTLYNGLNTLPHFNPDLEGSEPPSVLEFRERLRASDGLLISSPEYAHGVPGVLKNALDWLVSGSEIVGKPVALWNASPRATHGQASLTETLRVMSTRLVDEAFLSLPLAGKKLDEDGIMAHPELSSSMRAALTAFALAVESGRTSL